MNRQLNLFKSSAVVQVNASGKLIPMAKLQDCVAYIVPEKKKQWSKTTSLTLFVSVHSLA